MSKIKKHVKLETLKRKTNRNGKSLPYNIALLDHGGKRRIRWWRLVAMDEEFIQKALLRRDEEDGEEDERRSSL